MVWTKAVAAIFITSCVYFDWLSTGVYSKAEDTLYHCVTIITDYRTWPRTVRRWPLTPAPSSFWRHFLWPSLSVSLAVVNRRSPALAQPSVGSRIMGSVSSASVLVRTTSEEQPCWSWDQRSPPAISVRSLSDGFDRSRQCLNPIGWEAERLMFGDDITLLRFSVTFAFFLINFFAFCPHVFLFCQRIFKVYFMTFGITVEERKEISDWKKNQ